ncbi:ABC transporter ATP-binding protein [Butyrivibrio sp. AE2005]|uniref:ABC transporter ATP-binding protein n=1 Tax=Butyrivibrio sp. AE2005 TaxID=1496722 RepID=UPI0009E02930|nr:ABC transporter ATP-binding protein [Butyrivibrio sp. AE2005]
MNLIHAYNLEKHYYIENPMTLERKRIDVINDVSFQINKNESVAIMGKSGCGKTTLLKMLGGILFPTSGEIRYKGEILSGYNNEQLEIYRRTQIGFVFQDYKLLENMTIKENMILPCILDHQDIEKALERVETMAEMLQIGDRIDHYPCELSGGEKQRAAIGRALINFPSLLLADEPTGNLDTQTSKIVMDLLINIQKELKISMVLVTHDKEIADCCDRIVSIMDGKTY